MNTNQNEYMEAVKKRTDDYIISKVIFVVLAIMLRIFWFPYEQSAASGAEARVTKSLGSDFHLSIEFDGEKKTKVIQGNYKDMEFSPSGRYLLVETKNYGKYQMYICDTEFIDSSQWYIVTDDLNSMAEWIFRGNDMTIIKPDDEIVLEFDSWDKEKDYIKFEYTILFPDGTTNSGKTIIDYTQKTVVYMQPDNQT